MNTRHLHILDIVLSMVAALLITGCSSDETAQDSRQMRDLYLVLGTHAYNDVTEPITRALPNGYVVYDDLTPKMAVADTKIHCFLTRGSSVDFQGDFIYNGSSSWFSKVPLDDDTYYVYGFMPSAEKAEIATKSSSTYSQGAVITFSNMNTVSNSDICVIVGVLGANDNLTPIADKDMKLGHFEYNAGNEGDHVYLLMNHLYAALQFSIKVNTDYNQLRTIKLTKLELQSTISATATVTATLTPNGDGTSPLSISQSLISGNSSWLTVYDGEEQVLDDITPLDLACFAASGSDNKAFKMRTTYNVYDRKGNLIRKESTAENTLTLKFDSEKTALVAGEKYTFNLTVNPTYLYVLSDPDLDNPTVTVSN